MKETVKIIVLILFINLLNQNIKAQDEDFYYKGKFFISPDFGLLFGTTTMIEVSPAVGYYISDRFSVAAGFIYEYYKQSNQFLPNFQTEIYGPRVYSRFTLIKNLSNLLPVQSNLEIMAHTEYESLSLENEYFGSGNSGRFWYHTILIGGGISQRSSYRTKFNALVLWDVDTSTHSPNSNPVIRIGIQIMLGKIDYDY